MKVTIHLRAGPHYREEILKSDVQKNIDAIDRAIKNKKIVKDDVLLFDVISVLRAIQHQLPH